MTNQQLATIHGISAQAVGRWSAERKRRAIIEANAVVNPEVKKLIGELAGLCYAVQVKDKCQCSFELFHFVNDFNVLYDNKFIVFEAPLNTYELQGAIAKLEELIYG